MMREIITITAHGCELIGTMHRPTGPLAGTDSARALGVLMLNAGPAPRSGNSDLSAHMCDHLAARGIAAFRFDMPGLGDTNGQTPELLDDFWKQVLNGRNDQPTLDVLAALREKFGIAQFVVGGLCAGAVTALRAADVDRRDIAALLLLEPNFRLEGEVDPRSETQSIDGGAAEGRGQRNRLATVFSLQSWLHLLTGDRRVARVFRPLRGLMLSMLASLAGHSLPKDANVRMALTWHRVMRRRVPMLVLTAADRIEDRYCRRILESIPASDARCVSVVGLHDTNHIFTAGTARDQVIRAVTQWINEHFASRVDASAPNQAHGAMHALSA